ncbi:MAG TPA: VWA-like domain-containing protein [Aldersonia sp.]
MSETVGVLRSAGVARDRVRILACDAGATVPQRVRAIREVHLVGGGGTDMRVGIAAANAARPAPQVVVVVFTDGDTPWPAAPARSRLVCAVIGNPSAQTPPWARTVHITPAA